MFYCTTNLNWKIYQNLSILHFNARSLIYQMTVANIVGTLPLFRLPLF